jgi:hypothetical protein
MRKPGPTPDTTIEMVDHDGSTYMLTFDADDNPIEVQVKLYRGSNPNRVFYGYRRTWAIDEKLTPKVELILAQATTWSPEPARLRA